MSADETTAVTLARIEGKLDLLHAALTSVQAMGADHETRLRVIEAARVDPARVDAVEGRVADLEARPIGITPAKFLATVVSFGSIAATAASVITLLTR